MPKITKRVVDASHPDPERRFYVWDSEVKGFGLLVLPTGVKSYFFRYRTPEARERRLTIGQHGNVTADQARAIALEYAATVHRGGDPLGDRQERRKSRTVSDLLAAYLASAAFLRKAASTQGTDRGRINRHLIPLLGQKHVDKLTPGEIQAAFAAIRDGKTAVDEPVGHRARARVTGGEGTARKAVQLLRAALAWAVHERLTASNPAEHVKIGRDGSRDTILDGAADYARLFQTLDKMQAEHRIRPAAADAIRIIALTGARKTEIAGLQWGFVDLKKGLLTIPSTAHKTGAKTGKARVIGLPSAAQAIIARQSRGSSDERVFRPAHGSGVLDLQKPWAKLRAEAGLPDGIGLHGLRHSLASHMAMAGAQASEVMTVLGHRDISTSAKYVHWTQDARQGLSERAAATAIAGMSPAVSTDVVALGKAKK